MTAETRLVALLGHPVAGSLSPAIQNAAFAAVALDWAYVALAVPPDRLQAVVRGLAAAGFAGANVTRPHKIAAAELCDELDGFAERAGSVNTLVFAGDRISGSSTDGEAVVAALGEVARARALILGAGGVARAVAAALVEAGGEVTVAARRADQARRLAGDVGGGAATAPWPVGDHPAALVVNATPLVDEVPAGIRPEQTVVDLAYRADGRDTALVEAARAAGAGVVDGREILVLQAAASFARWTGVPAPLAVMRAAVRPH